MIRTYAWEPGADLAPLSELRVTAATIPDTLDTTQETP